MTSKYKYNSENIGDKSMNVERYYRIQGRKTAAMWTTAAVSWVVVVLIAAGILVIAVTSARSAPVTLTLTDEEQQALVQVLDSAVKSGTAAQARVPVYFLNKLEAAIQASRQPVPPPEPPK